jgi:hypothetical protein
MVFLCRKFLFDEVTENVHIGKADRLSRAEPGAGSALNHAVVLIYHRRFLTCFIKSQDAILADSDTFSTANAFFGINGRKPGDFFTGYATPIVHR